VGVLGDHSGVATAVFPSLAVSVLVVGGIAATWVSVVVGRARRERAELRAHGRAKRAKGAATEAAEESAFFSPEELDRAIDEMLKLAGAVWRSADSGERTGRPDELLIRGWARSREAWLGGTLELQGRPSVDLMQVVNRGGESEDRVIARVRLRLHCPDPKPFGEDSVGNLIARRHARLDERWTLGRSGGRWVLLSVEGDPLSGPVLSAPLVPTSSADLRRLKEQSLAELASAEKVPEGAALSDLVPADEPPSLALLDLSLVDGRFLPALIAAAVAHLVEAWEEASSGADAPLAATASKEASDALLHPSAGTRMVVRDAELKSWRATGLELARRPPTVQVQVEVQAVRYVERADGRLLAGSADVSHLIVLAWVLELVDSKHAPWRLQATSDPAQDIPGAA
jgi:hypothetical protein